MKPTEVDEIESVTGENGSEEDDVFVAPASYAQQRLWFLHQLEPESGAYNMLAAVHLRGRLDIAMLERSLTEVVRRHETLRTGFIVIDNQPMQVISQKAQLEFEQIDLSHLPADKHDAEVRWLALQKTKIPFDLEKGGLIRAVLMRLGADDYVLCVVMDHIISDAWSIGVLISEMLALYSAYCSGQPSPLPELEIQYVDYAQWQREWLAGEVLEEQLSYWKQQLSGPLPVLELPADRPRQSVQTFKGASEHFTLTKDLSEAVRALSRQHGSTTFMTLLAAFQLLLQRYTGMSDIPVGTPIAGRSRPETESLIGFFVNTLVMRTSLSGDPPFTELLARVREVSLDAYTHQDVPFEILVEELQPVRVLGHPPLCQVMFALENAPMPEMNMPGLNLTPIDIETGTAKFDITLIFDEGEHLTGSWEYNTDRFDRTTIQKMSEHFLHLLEVITTNPEQHLSQISLLSTTARQQLLYDLNQTGTDFPLSSCIHHLIEAQVHRTPDAIAARSADDSLTFAQLDARANQLAHFLLDSGIRPHTVVALLLDHSCETLIAILGVLKAGCAYLPLDPSHPPARMAFALTDAQAAMLITTHTGYERLGGGIAAHLPVPPSANGSTTPTTPSMPPTLYLDTDWQRCAALSTTAPSLPLPSSTAAYLIYTSGSTGVPKGVVIEHSSLVNYICWAQTVYQQAGEPADCALYSSLAFDLTVTSIFLPLISGHTIRLYPQRDSEPSLLEVMADNRVHLLKLTPSHLSLIREFDNRNSNIRNLIVGGEALSTELAYAVSQSFGHRVLIYNEYGPTEATVGCMLYRFDPAQDKRVWVPIGRPAANTQIYILDERLEPVAEHVTGELYIGGEGLARGYLNRAELSAERFIPDPFSGHVGGRLYRTGDLARQLADRTVEYLGRNDEQVKYHGYRVELNELRMALSAHERVRDAVVVVRRNKANGSEGLVGYYVGREAIAAEELRAHMQERVIAETVPQWYVHLRRLPLTLNGKVNVEALPDPWEGDGEGSSAGGKKEGSGEARTPAEAQLVEIWKQVLGRERVRIDDNFFELGGHSLLATQLISRVHQCFQVELPLRMLFATPTVAELAEHLQEMTHTKQELIDTPPPIERSPRDGHARLSFAQKRLWFQQQLDATSTNYNIASAVRLTGPLDEASLERTFSEIVLRHEALRTTFAVVEGEPVQIIGEPVGETLSLIDLSHLPASEHQAEIGRHIEAEASRPFDLVRGPLLRVQLLRLSMEEHVLLVLMHHIVSDGWSIGVLIREVATLYAAYIRGEESPLQELPIQYADFAHWQREWLQGEVLAAQLAYWQAALEGAPAVINLPTDRPRLPARDNHGARHSFEIPLGLTAALKQLGHQKDTTLFMVLQASFLSLLHYHTGEVDVVVGTDVANRNRVELEGLIGFFVNQLVLRTSLSGDPTFEELLERVREVALGAYAHQHLPFDSLVEMLNPERSMLYSPLFQVKLVLQNTPLPPMELTGLTLNLLEVERNTAKFDILFNLREDSAGLKCNVEYSTSLFDAKTIERMAAGFATILGQVAENPGARLSELSKLLAELDNQQQSMLQAEFKGIRRQKLKNVVPKPVVSPMADG